MKHDLKSLLFYWIFFSTHLMDNWTDYRNDPCSILMLHDSTHT